MRLLQAVSESDRGSRQNSERLHLSGRVGRPQKYFPAFESYVSYRHGPKAIAYFFFPPNTEKWMYRPGFAFMSCNSSVRLCDASVRLSYSSLS